MNVSDPTQTTDLVVTDEQRVSYHMAEFDWLKKEIASLVDQTTRNLTYAIAASGATVAWLATHRVAPNLFFWAKAIPFALAVLFAGFTGACYIRISEKAAYLKELEGILSFGGLGWQRRFEKRKALIGLSSSLVWITLTLGTAIVWTALPYPASNNATATLAESKEPAQHSKKAANSTAGTVAP